MIETNRIDGIVLEKMVINGYNNLLKNEKYINSINVFPVPDGDTGSNMRLTLENALKYAKTTRNAGAYLYELAEGALYGARGNSGVIFSQIINGLANELRRDSIINSYEFVEGFETAKKFAYKSVVAPMEGTMLTVLREGIDTLDEIIGRNTKLVVFFNNLLNRMKESLANTPNLMPVLKDANVVDSGGLGLVVFVEGMFKYLLGEIIEVDKLQEIQGKQKDIDVDEYLISDYIVLSYGYCTEFLLKLFETKEKFNVKDFTEKLQEMGNSLAIYQEKDKNVVKVHIHAKKPGEILSFAQRYGEFVFLKIENMDLQSKNEISTVKKEQKDIVKIAVINGEGAKTIYQELGCDCLIEASNTMSASCEDFLSYINNNDAEYYVLVPNNKNNLLASKQAEKLAKGKKVVIIPSINLLEGYNALACDEPTSKNLNYRIKSMNDGKDGIQTFSMFKASKDSSIDGINVVEGNYTSMMGNFLLSSSSDFYEVLMSSLRSVKEIDSLSYCIVLKGRDYSFDDDEIIAKINEKYENLEVVFLDGGQSVYDLIIGVK